MGRHISAIDEWETYIPDIENERDLFERSPEESITMEIRFLTKDERSGLNEALEKTQKARGVSRIDAEKKIIRILDSAVRNIKNYSIDDIEIRTGEDLWGAADNAGEAPIMYDVILALISRASLDKGLAKKLAPPSVTSTAPRKECAGGGAPLAINQSQLGQLGTQMQKTQNSNSTTSTSGDLEIAMENSEPSSMSNGTSR